MVDLARADAVRLGHADVGSEHLLLGLLRQSDTSMAAAVFESFGISLPAARDGVRFMRGQLPNWERPSVDPATWASAWAPMDLAESISWEDSEGLTGAAMDSVEIGLTRLKRVIAIGQGRTTNDVLVELIALELRDGGGILMWRTETEDDRMLGSADIAVDDDAGTLYTALPASWSGSGRESRGETRIFPSPPDSASSLTITVRSFGRDPWPVPPMAPASVEVTGPWTFDVPLG